MKKNNKLYNAAKKNYEYIVVEDYYCDNPDIYGSDASYSSLEMGGGKLYFEIDKVWHDLEQATDYINDYYNN